MTFATDGNKGLVILLSQSLCKTPINATCIIYIVYGHCRTAWNAAVVCAIRLSHCDSQMGLVFSEANLSGNTVEYETCIMENNTKDIAALGSRLAGNGHSRRPLIPNSVFCPHAQAEWAKKAFWFNYSHAHRLRAQTLTAPSELETSWVDAIFLRHHDLSVATQVCKDSFCI